MAKTVWRMPKRHVRGLRVHLREVPDVRPLSGGRVPVRRPSTRHQEEASAVTMRGWS